MCGRYALNRLNAADIANWYPRVRPNRFQDEERFHGRFNVAPRTYAPVIRRGGGSSGSSDGAEPGESHEHHSNSELIIQSMRWGVVPHFQKHDEPSGMLKTINARGEHLTDGTSSLWNSLKGKKRCVVPVNGYYEWLKKPGGEKVPHFTKYPKDATTDDGDRPTLKEGELEEKPLLLAGLWDSVTLEGSSEPLYTFCIVTTESSKQLSFLHDRMPVVLTSQDDIELWLGPSEWSKALNQLIRPSDVKFECYPVPKEVGKVGTEDASFILPVSKRKDGIEAMFQKQQKRQDKASSSKTEAKAEPSSPSPQSSKEKTKVKAKVEDESDVVEISDKEEDAKPRRPQKEESETEDSKSSVGGSQSKSASTSAKRKTPASPSKTASPSKKPKKESKPPPGSTKITSFFKSSSQS